MKPIFQDLRKAIEPLAAGHGKGSKSNQDLHNAMHSHIANLKLLSGPLDELQHSLPSLEAEKSKYHISGAVIVGVLCLCCCELSYVPAVCVQSAGWWLQFTPLFNLISRDLSCSEWNWE